MFMMSFRLKKTALLYGGLVALLAVVVGIGLRSTGGVTVEAGAQASQTESAVKVKKVTGKTNEDRLRFIHSFGWEVNEEPAEIMEVIIPSKFDEVYETYNSIQKKQGLDLKSVAGKRCRRFSYEVTNYPGAQGAVRINLLIYKNKIIGGDVCSLEADGFIHGFSLQ